MRKGSLAFPATLDFIPYLLLAAAVAVAYANIYGNAFVGDDIVLISHNPLLHSWRNWTVFFTKTLAPGCPYYRPIHGLLHLAIFQIAGLSTVAFHLPNVILHAANAGLVYWLGRKLGFGALPVFLAALLWALHPIQTESVTQMSGVADVLYSFFCLLGAIVLFPDFSRRRFWLAALFMLPGLMSKEAAAIFPLLALCCMLYSRKSGKHFEARVWLRIWPLVLTAFIYSLVWLTVLFFVFRPSYVSAAYGHVVVRAPQHLFNYAALATPFYYLKMLLWPAGLHMEHDLPLYGGIGHAAVLAGLAILVLAAAQILRPQSDASRPLTWGLCWFIAAQLPTALFLSDNKIYEHWLYLPSAGLMLGVFESAARWTRVALPQWKKQLAYTGAVLALIMAPVLGFLSFRQNEVWRTPESFLDNTLQHDGPHLTFHIGRGILYAQGGAYDKAVGEFQSVAKNPASGSLSHAELANMEAMWGSVLMAMPKNGENREEALGHFITADTLDPDSVLALDALAHYYMEQGDARDATVFRDRAETVRKKTAWAATQPDAPKE